MDTFDNLPVAYFADSNEQVTAPCWRLLAPGYYGDTFWLDGEVLTMDITPNHHLEPLNKAAGERMTKWLGSLPLNSTNLRSDDLIEASHMLVGQVQREGIQGWTHEKHSAAVIKLALELKARREGTGALKMPELQGVQPVNRPGAPPMPNATFSNPQQASFGQQQGQVTHQPQLPNRRVRRVAPATGNLPPAGNPQAA